MSKKSLIFLITIISLAGFVTTFKIIESRGKTAGKTNILTETKVDPKKEKEEITKNTEKYQPKVTGKTKEAGLDISAASAIVVDENTNEILFQKNPKAQLPPASITKIATISVVLENLKKDDLITISQKAADTEPNKIVMKTGEKIKVDDLLYGLMMISANDAAVALAEAMPGGYDGCVKLMNQKVKMLGLSNTSFVNPNGLDDEKHYSSAFDIATLTRYGLLNHPEIITYAGQKEEHAVFPTDHNESHWWSQISHMLYAYQSMIAAKTGYTDTAKSTFIGVAERNGRRLTVVIFGATDANGDVKKLLDFGFSN